MKLKSKVLRYRLGLPGYKKEDIHLFDQAEKAKGCQSADELKRYIITEKGWLEWAKVFRIHPCLSHYEQ